jgi:hypothetical protein
MRELNPNHPVTQKAHDHWHKIVAIILHKFSDILPNEIQIFPRDIEALERAFSGDMPAVVLEDRDGALRVRLVTMRDGEKLARKAGGLPA